MRADAPGIMESLKSGTADQHRAAERRALQQALVAGRLPMETYRRWLGQMLLLHQALWKAVLSAGVRHPVLEQVVQDKGLHVANLESDLQVLGGQPEGIVALPSTSVAVATIQRAATGDAYQLLGYNYVLEGSMNGNRFIARALEPTIAASAATYLDPYGAHQRAVWQAYRERMNRVDLEPAQVESILAAARQMFDWIGELSDALMSP